jgi:hypothetical protein
MLKWDQEDVTADHFQHVLFSMRGVLSRSLDPAVFVPLRNSSPSVARGCGDCFSASLPLRRVVPFLRKFLKSEPHVD